MALITLEKISILPESLFSKILTETSVWDLRDRKYENFNTYFKKHHVKGFKVNNISRFVNSTEIPNFLTETIDWVQSIIGTHYEPVQAMLNAIMPGQQFPVHIDSLRLHQFAKRYHICLDNSEIEYYFFVKEQIIKKNMEPGYLYFYNNLIPHSVRNTSTRFRTNLILDMIPNNVDTSNLLDVIPEVVKECHNVKTKFYSDPDLFGFTTDSIN